MASNSVFDTLKSRLGSSIIVTLGSDAAAYRGTLIGVLPEGTDISDSGANPTASDYISLTVRLSRAKR